MQVISFNINSLRARIHQLSEIINKYQPDVIGLQETKVHDDMFPVADLEQFGYHLSYHGQKGHYGVALLTKAKPVAVYRGFPTDDEQAQRRLIVAEVPTTKGNIMVVNGYFPQGESRDNQIKFPAKEKFYQDLTQYIQQLNLNQQMSLIMGDMNISASDLDIGLPEESKKRWLRSGKCSFLPEEQAWLQQILSLGFVDTFRQQYPDLPSYSWFDYRSRGFDSNTGLRIDLILASRALAEFCQDSGIDLAIRAMDKPSDHAPIWAKFSL